jgi:dTDP-4-dehydrorhamnose reductase
MRILLTGSNGQVGWELNRALMEAGEVIAFDRTTLDLSDYDRVGSKIREARPDVVVNAAAYTAVDAAESDEYAAAAINSVAPAVIADTAKAIGALFVHYSTDYVFDGSSRAPYKEEDVAAPLNAYGRTKLAGEQAIMASGCRYLILRTSWVYADRGRNFLLAILRRAAGGACLKVVDDQRGAPTSAASIADATKQILCGGRIGEVHGLYHLSASGVTTWHGFATEILAMAGIGASVEAIPTVEYPTPARRPRNSLLDNSRIQADFGLTVPDWRDGLRQVLEKMSRLGLR